MLLGGMAFWHYQLTERLGDDLRNRFGELKDISITRLTKEALTIIEELSVYAIPITLFPELRWGKRRKIERLCTLLCQAGAPSDKVDNEMFLLERV